MCFIYFFIATMSNIDASNIWEKKTNKVPYEKCKKGKGPKKVSPYVKSFIVKLENRPRTLSPSLKKNILGKNLRILKVKYSRERRLSEPPYLFYMIYLRCSVAGVNIRIASLIVWCLTGLLLFRDCFRSCSQRKADLINF